MKLAFCGLGLMGEPMVKRLLAAGHTVHVWNRTPAKAQALLKLGAQWCDTPAEAASGVDGVFMCLLNTQAVEQVVFGPDGIVHARQLRWLVDHSSVPPEQTRAYTTTGFGDFLPSTKTAKFCVTMHVILVFCFVILGVKI